MTTTVGRVLELVAAGPARLGGGRLLLLDGPAGSGKTTLAAAVAEAVHARVIHTDELLDGWGGGLPRMVDALVGDVLTPLAEDRRAAWRRYDWIAGQWAERVPVAPLTDGELLVVEGVAAGSRDAAAYASAVVWVDAPHDLRMERGIARDGEAFRPHWERWAAREVDHFARERTRERADLVVTTG